MSDPACYVADKKLEAAVDVAMALELPLLVTGEPGCGKTQLAYWVAQQKLKIAYANVYKFSTRSTSVHTDLFYRFDSVRMFHKASGGQQNLDAREFLRYEALGEAIRASQENVQTLVLIDEVDKAPRDFPNDLLGAIENLEFSVPELVGDEGKQQQTYKNGYKPVVIVTSNSENVLPDAFLRRCVYFHLPFPDKTTLEEIVHKRCPNLGTAGDLIFKLFLDLREPTKIALRKKPGIAELLQALDVTKKLPKLDSMPASKVQEYVMPVLVKTEDDRKLALELPSPEKK